MPPASVSEQSSLSLASCSIADGFIAQEMLSDIQKFVEAATTMTVDAGYQLGAADGWQSLWEVSLAAMEHRRESITATQERVEAMSPKKLPQLQKTPRKPARPRQVGSVSAGPSFRKGRRQVADSRRQRIRSSEDLRSPGALQLSPKPQENQQREKRQSSVKQTNSTSPKPGAAQEATSPAGQGGKATLLNAIRNLPRDKQQELLRAVAEMEQEFIASHSPLNMRAPKVEDFYESGTKLPAISRPTPVTYGDYDETHYILEKIAVAMQVKGSKKTPNWQWHRELVRPSMMRDRLEATLDVSLSGREVALLMRRFDEQRKGVVDICEILYRAAQIADEHRERRRKRKMMAKKPRMSNPSHVGKQRKLPRISGAAAAGPPSTRDREGSIWSVSGEQETSTIALQKLAELAYTSIVQRKRLPLETAKYVSEMEFRRMIDEQGGSFTTRELAVLIRRYKHHASNRIDQQAFISEFLSLGKDEIRKRRQKQAQNMFLEALSRGNSEEALGHR